jgi:parallel beta-helix repeat protein
VFLQGSKTFVKANPNVINIPSDYATIQLAVNNASAGDIIFVSTGVYYEHVTIDKSLTLRGENGSSIIDGNCTGPVIKITADNVNINGFTIQNGGWSPGIYQYSSSNSNISDNIVINNGHGILLENSTNNILTRNNVSHNYIGIGLDSSSNSILTRNNVSSSVRCGIGLSSSSNNILDGNFASNNEHGIWLDYSTNVTVTGNSVTDNLNGISLDHSDNITIFHNNIINNTQQTRIIDSANMWDSDYEGNYWSNYNGIDADQDGIGDSPRIIDANNTDNYPLMGTFSDFTITWEEQLHHVTTICNSTISNFNFEVIHDGINKTISFNVTGEDGTAGFCRIRIPTALMNDTFTVYVDGVNTTYTRPRSDATHSYLYFTYNHSTKKVIIIPEFPSPLLPYLLMTLTLAATAYLKRKTTP